MRIVAPDFSRRLILHSLHNCIGGALNYTRLRMRFGQSLLGRLVTFVDRRGVAILRVLRLGRLG